MRINCLHNEESKKQCCRNGDETRCELDAGTKKWEILITEACFTATVGKIDV